LPAHFFSLFPFRGISKTEPRPERPLFRRVGDTHRRRGGKIGRVVLSAGEKPRADQADPAAEQAALRRAVQEFGIRTGSLDVRAASLSGGNQQKLALAKVLHPGPSVVVLDEPTRGVDVGAKREIYHLVQRLAEQGLAVVVISSELMELIGLCHRVAVMRAGRLQTTLQAPHLTEEELIAHATGTR